MDAKTVAMVEAAFADRRLLEDPVHAAAVMSIENTSKPARAR